MDKRRSSSTPTWRGRRTILVIFGAVVAGLVWMGCTVTDKNYRLLSFFFDGVPNPNALPIMAESGNPAAIRQSPTYVAHPPFLNNQCDACHRSRFTQEAITSDVCLKCHSGVPNEYPFMHGPVTAGACLWCHVPHESAFAHLLKARPRAVCTQCHEPALLDSERVPEHADESKSCLDCHRGHGGQGRNMLRDSAKGTGNAGG